MSEKIDRAKDKCGWVWQWGYNVWTTGCGQEFIIDGDAVETKQYQYCPECGCEIVDDTEDEDAWRPIT